MIDKSELYRIIFLNNCDIIEAVDRRTPLHSTIGQENKKKTMAKDQI